MTAVSVEAVGVRDGKQVVQAVILSDSAPVALPTDGADIIGMNANQVFAPFSFLYITGDTSVKVFIADENGIFQPQ